MREWSTFLSYLEEKFGKKTIDKWIRPLTVLKFDARNIYLDADHPFHIHWFYEHIDKKMLSHFHTPSGTPIAIHLFLKGESIKKSRLTDFSSSSSSLFPQSHLEPQAILANFLTGQERHLPLEILHEWIEKIEKIELEIPFYLYGPKGSGKTHLLMAITHALREKGVRPFYIRGEEFADHVVRAFRSATLDQFRLRYREIDVLLVDDIDRLAKKGATQEEFFHTFNYLHDTKCPIILTAPCSPDLLEEIEPRLISRFEWGLTLPMPNPSTDLKREIMKQKARELSIKLSKPLIDFLLETFPVLSSLLQSLEALTLRSSGLTSYFDLKEGKKLLDYFIEKETSSNQLTPSSIIDQVSRHFGIKSADLLSRSQAKECSLPRQIAMYLCRNDTDLSYVKIGKLFNRDHSTVITSIKNMEKRLEEKDREISFIINKTRKAISSQK